MIQNCHCIDGPRRALQGPLVPAEAGTQSILDSRFGGNERRLSGDFVALGKQDVMPATSAGITGEGNDRLSCAGIHAYCSRFFAGGWSGELTRFFRDSS